MSIRFIVTGAILACGLMSLDSQAEAREPADTRFAIERFNQDLRGIVRKHFPEATGHVLNNEIHFEQDTRVFIVHEPTKTGVWQDPWPERGPKKGGIYCDIEYRAGRYEGAAVLPQSFDKRYFTTYVAAPYSEKLDAHLHVQLKYSNTGKPPAGFVQEVLEQIKGFDKYIDAREARVPSAPLKGNAEGNFGNLVSP